MREAGGTVVPLVDSFVATGAEHCAVVPPLEPAQLQFHGPLPVTAEAAPVLHRFVLGAVLTATPLAEPHWPFTIVGRGSLVPTQPEPFQLHQPYGAAVPASW